MLCPSCKTESPEGSKFCTGCGYDLLRVDAIPAPPVQLTLSDFGIETGTLKSFLKVTGGSILYVLSAAAILYGIGQNVGPMLTKAESLGQALSCFAAVNVYELALLAVLVAIVKLRNVTDDAISLVILAALFLVASGLTLGTVAYHEPRACVLIGLGAAGLGVLKLLTMKRQTGLQFDRLALAGFAVILLWNFLSTAVMSRHFVGERALDPERRMEWLISFAVLTVGAAMVLLSAIRSKERDFGGPETKVPLLRTPAMTWILGLVLLAAACGHQYAMGYMFVIEHSLADYLWLAGIGALLLLELVRSAGHEDSVLENIIALIPLGLVLMAIAGKFFGPDYGLWITGLWNVTLMLSVFGAAVLAMAFRHERFYLLIAVLGYVLGVILTAGYNRGDSGTLNYRTVGVILITAILLTGIVKQSLGLVLVTFFAASIATASSEGWIRMVKLWGIETEFGFVGLIGLSCILTALIFGRKSPKLLIFCGAAALMACGFNLVYFASVQKIFLAGVAAVLAAVILYLRNGVIVPGVILMLPAITKTGPMLAHFDKLADRLGNWWWVIIGFGLLFAGAAASFYKGRNNQKKFVDASKPVNMRDEQITTGMQR